MCNKDNWKCKKDKHKKFLIIQNIPWNFILIFETRIRTDHFGFPTYFTAGSFCLGNSIMCYISGSRLMYGERINVRILGGNGNFTK